MKYGIITHYDVLNHGAMLQLNGLKEVLYSLGIDAQALQFEKNYDFMDRKLQAKYKIGIKSIFIYLKFLWQRGLLNTFFLYRKTKLQEVYKKEHSLIGKFYSEYHNLDGIVIGSDEVFALHTGVTPVFFGHALPTDKVFAYAGSFGPTTIHDIDRLHCRPLIESGLNNMIGIGMRDQNSIQISTKLSKVKPALVCDPVILYGYKKELEKCKRPIIRKYLLVYAYDQHMNNKDEVNSIIKFARDHNLLVVSPGFYHKWVDKNVNPSYDIILSWFKYAEYVVTDTFHGAVMSLISGTEVAVKVRDNGNKLINLINEYCINNREIKNWDLEEVFSRPLQWNEINEQIRIRRKDSFDFLKRMVNL